jgi:hypothetical protein
MSEMGGACRGKSEMYRKLWPENIKRREETSLDIQGNTGGK